MLYVLTTKKLKSNFELLYSINLYTKLLHLSSLSFVEVTWTKNNTEIISTANYTVKVEGERHSLFIKSARISDGGKYCVTAVNQMGKASSSATLIVKAGEFDFCEISAVLW